LLRRLLRRKPIDPRHRLGQQGEAAAAKFLQKQGLRIITRNWTYAGGEIDLIAEEGQTLVIVEVKTRHAGQADPALQVGPNKLRRLRRAAKAYCRSRWPNQEQMPPVRIDVVAIDATNGRLVPRHYRDAGGVD
jgi:putative endonuclease